MDTPLEAKFQLSQWDSQAVVLTLLSIYSFLRVEIKLEDLMWLVFFKSKWIQGSDTHLSVQHAKILQAELLLLWLFYTVIFFQLFIWNKVLK